MRSTNETGYTNVADSNHDFLQERMQKKTMKKSYVRLKYCGFRYTEPPYVCEQHSHPHWELVYYDGLGVSTVNNVPFHYVAGSYVLIPSDTPHEEEALSRGKLYVIGFETEWESSELPNRIFFDTPKKSIKTMVDFIIAEAQETLPYSAQRINLLMQDVFLETQRQCTPTFKEADQKLSMILNYIDAYYTTDIHFEMLANSLSYSYDYLRHYFKEKMNISLKQYVTNKRVVLAKEYLLSDMPLAEISDSCGFSSAVYFSSVFRQSVGITPSQYREQCRRIDLVGETAEEEKP